MPASPMAGVQLEGGRCRRRLSVSVQRRHGQVLRAPGDRIVAIGVRRGGGPEREQVLAFDARIFARDHAGLMTASFWFAGGQNEVEVVATRRPRRAASARPRRRRCGRARSRSGRSRGTASEARLSAQYAFTASHVLGQRVARRPSLGRGPARTAPGSSAGCARGWSRCWVRIAEVPLSARSLPCPDVLQSRILGSLRLGATGPAR